VWTVDAAAVVVAVFGLVRDHGDEGCEGANLLAPCAGQPVGLEVPAADAFAFGGDQPEAREPVKTSRQCVVVNVLTNMGLQPGRQSTEPGGLLGQLCQDERVPPMPEVLSDPG
jgi:hypothetical protein